jgi:hypothetical protein
MLNKKSVMLFVISNIKMGFLNYFKLIVSLIIIRVKTTHDMNKDGNMEWMPMHGLDFIINLEGVIFCKVNVR